MPELNVITRDGAQQTINASAETSVMEAIRDSGFDELLAPDYALPDPARALAKPPGLAGIVHDLTLPTLAAQI